MSTGTSTCFPPPELPVPRRRSNPFPQPHRCPCPAARCPDPNRRHRCVCFRGGHGGGRAREEGGNCAGCGRGERRPPGERAGRRWAGSGDAGRRWAALKGQDGVERRYRGTAAFRGMAASGGAVEAWRYGAAVVRRRDRPAVAPGGVGAAVGRHGIDRREPQAACVGNESRDLATFCACL